MDVPVWVTGLPDTRLPGLPVPHTLAVLMATNLHGVQQEFGIPVQRIAIIILNLGMSLPLNRPQRKLMTHEVELLSYTDSSTNIERYLNSSARYPPLLHLLLPNILFLFGSKGARGGLPDNGTKASGNHSSKKK